MKHSKFLGVLAATLCLGLGTLTACDPGTTEESASGSKHVHSAAADAAWEGDDNNHWKPCAAGDKGQVDKAKHDFGEPYDKVNPTCTEAGSQKVKCKVCGKEVTQTVKATGHTYAKENGEPKKLTAPRLAKAPKSAQSATPQPLLPKKLLATPMSKKTVLTRSPGPNQLPAPRLAKAPKSAPAATKPRLSLNQLLATTST